jgi:hypothetical protein
MRATRFTATMAAALLASTLGTTSMVFAQSNPPSPSEPAPDNGMMDHGKMGRGQMMDMSQMNRMMENCNRMMEGAQHSSSDHNAKPDNG